MVLTTTSGRRAWIRARITVLIAGLLLALCGAPLTQADPQAGDTASGTETPAGGDAQPPGSTTLSLTDLGWADVLSFTFSRDVTSTNLKFPVPPGLTPVSFTAKLELPVELTFGRLTVLQDGQTVSRLETLPGNGSSFTMPLPGVKFWGNWLNLTLTMTAIPPDNFCWDWRSPIRLTGIKVTFSGAEAVPANVATFLPPVLRKLTIAVPAKPSDAESSAAVQLAAIIERRYGGQRPEVALVPRADGAPPPSAPMSMERVIVLKEGSDTDKGLSLIGQGMPALLISGPGEELANQVRMLGDDSLNSALSRKAVAGPLSFERRFAEYVVTMGMLLHEPQLDSEALWPEVGIPLDQTLWGHSVRGFQVYLIGSHTPLPPNLGGEVVITVDGEVIDRWPVDPGGVIDHRVDIPDRLLDRSTNLSIKVRTNGNSGKCGESPLMVLRINGATQIEAVPADPPVPPGFRSLPQTLMPRVQFGIGPDVFVDTNRAIQLVRAIQRTSAPPLTAFVTSLDQAVASGKPAVLIAAQGWKSDTIMLPVRADQGRVTIDVLDGGGNPTVMTLDTTLPIGSLQTVVDGHRSLLIATSNGSPAQLDELLLWATAERGRWSGLDGRAVLSVRGSEPVTVPNPAIELTPRRENFFRWSTWVVGTAIGVIAAAAAGALAILVRVRRRRSATGDPTGDLTRPAT